MASRCEAPASPCPCPRSSSFASLGPKPRRPSLSMRAIEAGASQTPACPSRSLGTRGIPQKLKGIQRKFLGDAISATFDPLLDSVQCMGEDETLPHFHFYKF